MRKIIELKNVSMVHGSGFILKNISFFLKERQSLGVLGPKGSGKTTLAKIIAGWIHTRIGEIFLLEKSAHGMPEFQKTKISFIPSQNSLLPDIPIRSQLVGHACIFGYSLAEGKDRVELLFKQFKISHIRDQVPSDLKLIDIKKIKIAKAMISDPVLIVFDELGKGLSKSELTQLSVILNQLRLSHSVSFIFFSEDEYEVELLSQRVLILSEGSVVAQGEISEVLRDEVGEHVVEMNSNYAERDYYRQKLKGMYSFWEDQDGIKVLLTKNGSHKDFLKQMNLDQFSLRKPSLKDILKKRNVNLEVK